MQDFVKDFYVCVSPISKKAGQVFMEYGNNIWKFLTIEDILKFSVLSRYCAKLPISDDTVNQILLNSKMNQIGRFTISLLQADLTIGLVRRILNRLMSGSNGLVSIDSSGRVVIDIGSAFKDQNAYLASSVTAIPMENNIIYDTEVIPEDQRIQKFLESASYDEYDDFNPRHPQPKDKTHRRGDSYFNSDMDAHIPELNLDLQSIANLAISLEKEGLEGLQ